MANRHSSPPYRWAQALLTIEEGVFCRVMIKKPESQWMCWLVFHVINKVSVVIKWPGFKKINWCRLQSDHYTKFILHSISSFDDINQLIYIPLIRYRPFVLGAFHVFSVALQKRYIEPNPFDNQV